MRKIALTMALAVALTGCQKKEEPAATASAEPAASEAATEASASAAAPAASASAAAGAASEDGQSSGGITK